jgi:hypothetical protein
MFFLYNYNIYLKCILNNKKIPNEISFGIFTLRLSELITTIWCTPYSWVFILLSAWFRSYKGALSLYGYHDLIGAIVLPRITSAI